MRHRFSGSRNLVILDRYENTIKCANSKERGGRDDLSVDKPYGVAYPPLLEARVWEFGPYSLIIIILIIVRFQTNPKRWLVDWGGHQVLTPVVRDASYSKAWVEFCFFQGVDDVQANKPPNSGNYNILALIESRLP